MSKLKIKEAAAPSSPSPSGGEREIRVSVFDNAVVTLGRPLRVEQVIELIWTGDNKLKG